MANRRGTQSFHVRACAATSAQGRFAGIASSALPGAWSVTVDHTPLRTFAAITGGDFHLATRLDGTLTAVTCDFTGVTVTQSATDRRKVFERLLDFLNRLRVYCCATTCPKLPNLYKVITLNAELQP